jgi:hypothetical protein
MHVLGHDDYGVKVVAFSVVVKAVLEHGVAGLRREGVAMVLAECDEEASSCGLIVRELAAIFVLSVKRMRRTLLSAGVGFHFHKVDYRPGRAGLSVTDELIWNVERRGKGKS